MGTEDLSWMLKQPHPGCFLGPGVWITLQRHPSLFTKVDTQVLCICIDQSGLPYCDCPHRQYLTSPAGNYTWVLGWDLYLYCKDRPYHVLNYCEKVKTSSTYGRHYLLVLPLGWRSIYRSGRYCVNLRVSFLRYCPLCIF